MDILVPSTPKRLRITPTMVDDFLIDPVLGAKVIMGVDLDAFEAVRLKTFWWVPEVIDSSGFSTAKTFTIWVYLNLRCVLISDQICGMYYQTFSTGQQTFWSNYRRRHAPIFGAQLGKFNVEGKADGKANSQGAACFNQYFKNLSEIKMPAPSWGQDAKTQASLRYNVVGIDEWPKVESMGDGINRQILGRLTRQSRHKEHPLWCNHQVLLGVPESKSHPGFARIRSIEKRIKAGDPSCAHISFCFKDYSNKKQSNGKTYREEHRIDRTLRRMKADFTAGHYLREVGGVWSMDGKGWYADAEVDKCIDRLPDSLLFAYNQKALNG